MTGSIKILSGRANPALAQEIAERLGISVSGVDIVDFPNENIFVRLHQSVRGQDVYIIQPTYPWVNRSIMELLIMIDTLKRASAGQITAVVPYYAYGRTDKKDQPRVPITARLVADMITTAGADRVVTIDLHAGQIQGFFNIPVDELTAFHILSEYLKEKDLSQAVITTADLGFAKKARNYAEALDLPLTFVEKRRSGRKGSTTESLTVIGEVADKDCIIVEDEIATGGTVISAVEILKQQGARDIYIAFTHAVLAGEAVARLAAAEVTELITTNTLAIPAEKRLPNLTVLSVASLLAEVIRRIHYGISVGELFGE
ncbi:MAG: ribose-phosphate pyrophosphokinase [Anaerolineae bacterium]|nr:ribose-phosphate pyrophosphokinase [Anaerolineae bacterium]